jgi:exopolyphosphatase
MYAFFRHQQAADKDLPILPYINTRSSHLRLRPEVAYWLAEVGVDTRHLVFSDSVDLKICGAGGRLQVTLVDHNELPPSHTYLNDAVVEIIDHHADGPEFPNIRRRIVQPVGSSATLVAEAILQSLAELLDDPLAKFLLGPILLDSLNLDPAKGRCHDKDILMASRLLTINPLPRDKVFAELLSKKTDPSGLSVEDLLIRDLKTWSVADLRMGISVIPILLVPWIEKHPQLFAAVEEFRLSNRFDLYLLMTFSCGPPFCREIIGRAADEEFIANLFASFLIPCLGLKPMADASFAPGRRRGFLCYAQTKTEISRKKLFPKLRRYLEAEAEVRP